MAKTWKELLAERGLGNKPQQTYEEQQSALRNIAPEPYQYVPNKPADQVFEDNLSNLGTQPTNLGGYSVKSADEVMENNNRNLGNSPDAFGDVKPYAFNTVNNALAAFDKLKKPTVNIPTKKIEQDKFNQSQLNNFAIKTINDKYKANPNYSPAMNNQLEIERGIDIALLDRGLSSNSLPIKSQAFNQSSSAYNTRAPESVFPYFGERIKSGLVSSVQGMEDIYSTGEEISEIKQVNDLVRDKQARDRQDFAQAEADSKLLKPNIKLPFFPAFNVVKLTGDALETIARMVPNIMLGAAGAPSAVSLSLMGASYAGSARKEALSAGATEAQATAYGLTIGGIEGAIESIFGGIPFMKGLTGNTVKKMTAPIKNMIFRTIAKSAFDVGGEGGEEIIAGFLEPYVKRATYDKTAQNATLKELAVNFGMGVLVSAIMQLPQSSLKLYDIATTSADVNDKAIAAVETATAMGKDYKSSQLLDKTPLSNMDYDQKVELINQTKKDLQEYSSEKFSQWENEQYLAGNPDAASKFVEELINKGEELTEEQVIELAQQYDDDVAAMQASQEISDYVDNSAKGLQNVSFTNQISKLLEKQQNLYSQIQQESAKFNNLINPSNNVDVSTPKETVNNDISTPSIEQGGTSIPSEEIKGVEGDKDVASPTIETKVTSGKLYREVGIDRLESYFDEDLYDAPYGTISDIYVSKSPELAIGQGENRGIKLEFSDKDVPLVKVDKPYNPDDGEYIIDSGTRYRGDEQKYLRPNLEKITIDKSFIGDVSKYEVENNRSFAINKARFNGVTLKKIRKNGWIESTDNDGNLVFLNPSVYKQQGVIEPVNETKAVEDTKAAEIPSNEELVANILESLGVSKQQQAKNKNESEIKDKIINERVKQVQDKIVATDKLIADWESRQYKSHGGTVKVGSFDEVGETPWRPGEKSVSIDSVNESRRTKKIEELNRNKSDLTKQINAIKNEDKYFDATDMKQYDYKITDSEIENYNNPAQAEPQQAKPTVESIYATYKKLHNVNFGQEYGNAISLKDIIKEGNFTEAEFVNAIQEIQKQINPKIELGFARDQSKTITVGNNKYSSITFYSPNGKSESAKDINAPTKSEEGKALNTRKSFAESAKAEGFKPLLANAFAYNDINRIKVELNKGNLTQQEVNEIIDFAEGKLDAEQVKAVRDKLYKGDGDINVGNKSEPQIISPKKITVSSNDVRDNTQTITINNGEITVTNRNGKTKVGSYTFKLSEWEKLDKTSGNPHSHKKRFIAEMNKKTFPDNYKDITQEPFISRIEDSQRSAIDEAYKQYKELVKQNPETNSVQPEPQQVESAADTNAPSKSETKPKEAPVIDTEPNNAKGDNALEIERLKKVWNKAEANGANDNVLTEIDKKIKELESKQTKEEYMKDNNGNKLLLYHGTLSKTEFNTLEEKIDPDSPQIGFGIHITPETGLAAFFAGSEEIDSLVTVKENRYTNTKKGRIYPVYVKYKNMLDATKIVREDDKEWSIVNDLLKLEGTKTLTEDNIDTGFMDGKKYILQLQKVLANSSPAETKNILKKYGYDIVKYDVAMWDDRDGGMSNEPLENTIGYSVFSPSQINFAYNKDKPIGNNINKNENTNIPKSDDNKTETRRTETEKPSGKSINLFSELSNKIVGDQAVINAVKNSDKRNALIEIKSSARASLGRMTREYAGEVPANDLNEFIELFSSKRVVDARKESMIDNWFEDIYKILREGNNNNARDIIDGFVNRFEEAGQDVTKLNKILSDMSNSILNFPEGTPERKEFLGVRKAIMQTMEKNQNNNIRDIGGNENTIIPKSDIIEIDNKTSLDVKVPVKNNLAWLDNAADRARERIKSRANRLMSGLPMDDLVDYSIIGADKIAHGVVDFTQWSKEMLDEFGSNLRLFIEGIYAQSKAMLEMTPDEINEMIGLSSKEEGSNNNDRRNDGSTLDTSKTTGDKPVYGTRGGNSGTNNQKSGDSENSGIPKRNSESGGIGDGSLNQEPGGDVSNRGDRPDDRDGRTDGNSQTQETSQVKASRPSGINFIIKPEDKIGAGGIKAKYKDNVVAIRLLKQLQAEGRMATYEEQKVLAKYVGWGAIPQAFSLKNEDWSKEYYELKDLLNSEEYSAAHDSTINAHYTSTKIIEAMYHALERLGVKKGKLLEPALGVGNFFGMIPQNTNFKLFGVELDNLTGAIAKQLYQDANIQVKGYQKTKFADNYFDVSISNVPFGEVVIRDKNYSPSLIHDYFFMKTIDKVRPGGIIAFITSTGTMDKQNPQTREYLSERSILLGAIRLPKNAFLKNAGTSVTTDIIFLQKKQEGNSLKGESWLNIGKSQNNIPINEYFERHPEMMLGTMQLDKSMYGTERAVLVSDISDITEYLNKAVSALPENIFDNTASTGTESKVIEDYTLGEYERNGSIVVRGDRAYRVTNGRLEMLVTNEDGAAETQNPIPLSKVKRIKGMTELRDALRDVLKAQKENNNKAIKSTQTKLNKLYDAFVKEYGFINATDDSKANMQAYSRDIDYYVLASSLEVYDKDTGNYKKGKIFTEIVSKPVGHVEKADTAKDALSVSLNEKGKIDFERMGELTGKSQETLINELGDLIYFDPQSEKYVIESEYLSGNVRDKLNVAEKESKENPALQRNVDALVKVQPKKINAVDIETRLGANWVGKEAITDFAVEIFEDSRMSITFYPAINEWKVTAYTTNREILRSRWGTEHRSAQEILEDLLNMKVIRVPIYDGRGDDRVLNPVKTREATVMAQAKADEMQEKFQQWLFGTTERRQYFVDLYNELMNSETLRTYNGSFLTFDNLVKDFNPRAYQNDAVARILFGGNTLLAHAVGSGKTAVMIISGQELKRLGIANKPMYVVPNHLLGQWQKDFFKLYPNANILVANKKDFAPKRRAAFVARVATSNWDAVVMSHSSFGMLGMSREAQEDFINEQISELEEAMIAANQVNDRDVTKRLATARQNLAEKLQALIDDETRDKYLDFEELGVDYLFIDEAHNFKNLFFATKMGRIAGVNSGHAKRAEDMFMKTKYISGLHGGKAGIVFATGTPVSNSMSEMYTMQKYVQPNKLNALGLKMFDAWAGTFGQVVSVDGVDKTGSGYKTKSKFARFFNAPELVKIYRSFADVITSDDLDKVADIKRPTSELVIVTAVASADQKEFIKELKRRERNLPPDPREDNHLKITNDGRYGALDMRLINLAYADNPASKLNMAVEKIFEEWENSKDEKLTQFVFSDLGTPKDKHKSQTGSFDEEQGYSVGRWYEYKSGEKFIVQKIRREKKGEDVKVTIITESGKKQTLYGDNVYYRAQEEPDDFDYEEHEIILNEDDTPDFEVKFDVYADIKNKLVNMGIPAQEIAFIHDAKTDVAKEKLFEKVRRGEIRVLLGSTAKMGEGMNAQDRAIALHHLDCPWKPASVEQRNGRIIRHGNINKHVRIYQYVTKGTFDAYIWDIIKTKATFISQIMSGNLTERSIENVFDPTVMDADAMMIASSENPLIGEWSRLKSQVATLDIRKKSFTSTLYEMQDKLIWHAKHIAANKLKLENAIKDLSIIQNINGDNFSIVIEGTTYDKRKEAGEAIIEVIRKLKPGKDMFVDIGTFAGLKVFIGSYQGASEITSQKEEIRVRLQGNTSNFHESVAVTDSPLGLIAVASNIINKFGLDEIHAERELADNEKSVKVLEEEVKKPFAKEEELANLKAELKRVEDTLKAQRDAAEEREVAEEGQGFGEESGEDDTDDATQESAIQYLTGKDTSTLPQSDNSSKSSKTVDDIIEILEKYVPVRTGKFRHRALGIFKVKPEVIRTKVRNDMPTISHEFGHYFDKKYSFSSSKTFDNELLKLGQRTSKKSYSNKQIRAEGVAEFMRLYLTDPNLANAQAPQFLANFETSIDSETLNFLGRLRNDITAIVNLPDNKMIYNTVSDYETRKSTSPKIDILRKVYDAWINDNGPFKLVQKMAEEKGWTGKNIYTLAQNYRGFEAKAISMLYDVQKDLAGNVVGKSLMDILELVNKKNSKNPLELREDFVSYLIARRAMDYKDRGLVMPLPFYTYSNNIAAMESLHPEFMTVFDDLIIWEDNNLQLLVEGGVMAQDNVDKIKLANANHMPLQRIREAAVMARPGSGNSLGQSKKVIKEARGSGSTIIDPIESIIINSFIIRRAAETNSINRTLAEMSKISGAGYLIENVAPSSKKTSFAVDEIQNQLLKMAKDSGNTNLEASVKTMTDDELDSILSIFRALYIEKDDEVTIYDNGKPKLYQVEPELRKAIKGLNGQQSNVIIRALNVPKRILQTGAVTTIDFVIRNMGKDTGTSLIQSETNLNPWDIFKGYVSAFKKDDYQKLFASSGGASEYLNINERAEAQKIEDDMFGYGLSEKFERFSDALVELRKNNNQRTRDKAMNALKLITRVPLDKIRDMIQWSEGGPRIAEMRKAMEKGMGLDEAIGLGRQLSQDFLRRGYSGKELNMVTAFFNANVQGVARLVESFSTPKKAMRTTLKGLLYVTLPSMLLYYFNHDDEDYKNLPEWRKSLFYNVPIGNGHFLSLPKPYGYGFIFGSLPEIMLDTMLKDEPEAWGRITESFLNHFSIPIIPSALKPLIELYVNKNYHGSPIENAADQNNYKYLVRGNNTSEISKLVGDVFKNKNGLSPKQIDHLVKGYTGKLGESIWRLPDTIKSGIATPKDIDEYPVIKSFVTDSVYGSASVDKLYTIGLELRKRTNETKITKEFRYAPKELQNAAASRASSLYSEYNQIASRFTDYRATIKKIDSSNDSPMVKKLKQRDIQIKMNSLAKGFNEKYQDYKEKYKVK